MPVIDRLAWNGLLGSERTTDSAGERTVVFPLQQSRRGGSGAFLAADSNDEQWWVKPLNNGQGERVVITEAIVGAVGKVIGAPVCDSVIIRIPEELTGWEFRPGLQLEAGLAHGSRLVRGAIEARELLYRDRDENRRHHAGVFAL